MGSKVAALWLHSTGSIVVAHGLCCSMACGIFLSFVLAGGFFTVEPPENSLSIHFRFSLSIHTKSPAGNLVCAVLCLVAQSCSTLCDSVDCSLPGSSVCGDSPGKNTGVGCHALFQGIFPTQG